MKKVFDTCIQGEHKTQGNSPGSKCLGVDLFLKTTINYSNENGQKRVFSVQTELYAEISFKNRGTLFWGKADTNLIIGVRPQKFNPGALNYTNGNWINGADYCTINYFKDSIDNGLLSETIQCPTIGTGFQTTSGKYTYSMLNSTLYVNGTVGELTSKNLSDFRANFVAKNLFITSIETCSYGTVQTNQTPWGVLFS